jgi:hypothetical protein
MLRITQVDRIIDPSNPRSDSVGTIAFKTELADKTLKFIELSSPSGVNAMSFLACLI